MFSFSFFFLVDHDSFPPHYEFQYAQKTTSSSVPPVDTSICCCHYKLKQTNPKGSLEVFVPCAPHLLRQPHQINSQIKSRELQAASTVHSPSVIIHHSLGTLWAYTSGIKSRNQFTGSLHLTYFSRGEWSKMICFFYFLIYCLVNLQPREYGTVIKLRLTVTVTVCHELRP